MASAYLSIYERDLPVLVTTDSILHALHRCVRADDDRAGARTLQSGDHRDSDRRRGAGRGLRGAHQARRRASAKDVDLYLTVARRLLVYQVPNQLPAPEPIKSVFDQEADVQRVLKAIVALKPDPGFQIYGSKRPLDWSQFQPRGHYSRIEMLQGYFRAMMWLGRVDLGFALAAPDRAFGARDVERERRDAAMLSRLVSDAGQRDALAALDRAIGFFVGLSRQRRAGRDERLSDSRGYGDCPTSRRPRPSRR